MNRLSLAIIFLCLILIMLIGDRVAAGVIQCEAAQSCPVSR